MQQTRLSVGGLRPNIIVVLADDLGYADVVFQGCADIPTPNLDRLAVSGLRCTRGRPAALTPPDTPESGSTAIR